MFFGGNESELFKLIDKNLASMVDLRVVFGRRGETPFGHTVLPLLPTQEPQGLTDKCIHQRARCAGVSTDVKVRGVRC